MYTCILVALDGGAASERALDEAIMLARHLGSTLHVFNVADAHELGEASTPYAPPTQLVEDWRIAVEALIPAAVARARAQGVTAYGTVRFDPEGKVSDAILEEARKTGAELIVMGTHGRSGLARLALGSEAESVTRESPLPVLVVRAPETSG
jgi:nucleotide-binding universal stress UspA family protein